MSCTTIVRGNTVTWTDTFYNQAGAVFNPDTAVVVIAYSVSGSPTTTTVSMTQAGDVWSASWDTTGADTGTIYWHVQASGTPEAAEDGNFDLTANAANL